jgi:hypothetical protein
MREQWSETPPRDIKGHQRYSRIFNGLQGGKTVINKEVRSLFVSEVNSEQDSVSLLGESFMLTRGTLQW